MPRSVRSVLVDAHAHLDKYPSHELDAVLDALGAEEIVTLSVSVDVPSFEATLELSERCPFVIPSFGVHPWEAPHAPELGDLEAHAARSPFIGEVGLDQRFVDDESHYQVQRRVFERFLDMARRDGKLINVHCSGAERETLTLLRSHGIERAIIHWYAGPLDVVREFLDDGFLVTVGVEVLASDHIRDIARIVPDELLLTETDNPGGLHWLTGELGRPQILHEVLVALSETRGTSPPALADTVRTNLQRVLRDDHHVRPWLARMDWPT